MKFYIVIPAHNESDYIGRTLKSLTDQSLKPSKVVVVDDNSSDNTAQIVKEFTSKYNWISLVKTRSTDSHLPGSKIVNAFREGFKILDEDFDIICKFDADLIFPVNYLETLAHHFRSDEKLGMAAGFCHIEKNGEWILEDLTGKDHIRGALKAYRKDCFKVIGQLKPSMGWDTVDELLARYHGWNIKTDKHLKVKHLKPTGQSYHQASKYLQGEAMYKLRYGFWITLISALKLAIKKRRIRLFKDYMIGYLKAKSRKLEFLVSEEEGQFIRQLRWKGILSKFF